MTPSPYVLTYEQSEPPSAFPRTCCKRAKRKAAAEGRTLTALIEEGLRFVVADKPKAQGKARAAARQHGHRRSMPGVDISIAPPCRRWKTSNTSSG